MMVSMSDIDWPATVLALLNSTPVVDGVAADVLGDDDDARRWLCEHGAAGEQDLALVRRLRDDLQSVVRGSAVASTLNTYLDGYVKLPQVDDAGLHWQLDPEPGWPTRIILAWGAIQRDNPGRLRPCGNPDCRLFLLDRTRAGTARWCSMSVCGNRMKVRRHYSRTAGN